MGKLGKSLYLKWKDEVARGSKVPLCVSGILLCVQCSIQTTPSTVVYVDLPGRQFDNGNYAGAAAAVGST